MKDMELNKKINMVWVVLGAACLAFSLYEGVAKDCWGPAIGIAVAIFVGFVFMKRNE